MKVKITILLVIFALIGCSSDITKKQGADQKAAEIKQSNSKIA